MLSKTKEVKLYPFRHRWSVENARWLVDGEELEGRPMLRTNIEMEKNIKKCLQIWPKGRKGDSEEYVAIEVGGWKVMLYGTVKVGEDESTERELGVADENGTYRLDEYIRRSTLLESANLLKNGVLTVCLEGVAWDEYEKFDPKKNLTSISALQASAKASSFGFAFCPPSPKKYFTTEWEVEADEEQIKARTVNVAHLLELDGQTTVGIRLAPHTEVTNTKGIASYLQLLQCSTDRLAMWWRVTVLTDGEEKVKSEGGWAAIWRRGEEKEFYHFVLATYDRDQPIPLRLRFEIIRIEDTTLEDEAISEKNLQNYENICNLLSSSWKESALRSQPSPPLPLPLLDCLNVKLVKLISIAKKGHAGTTNYSTTLPTVSLHNLQINSTGDFTEKLHKLLSETAQQIEVFFSSTQKVIVQVVKRASTDDQVEYAFRMIYLIEQRVVTLVVYITVLLASENIAKIKNIEKNDDSIGSPNANGWQDRAQITDSQPLDQVDQDLYSDSVQTFPTSLSEYTDLLLGRLEEMMAVAKKSGDTKVVTSYNLKGANLRNALLNFNATSSMGNFTVTEMSSTLDNQQLSAITASLTKVTSQLEASLNCSTKSENLNESSDDVEPTEPNQQFTATVLHLVNKSDQLQFTIRVTDQAGTMLDIEQTVQKVENISEINLSTDSNCLKKNFDLKTVNSQREATSKLGIEETLKAIKPEVELAEVNYDETEPEIPAKEASSNAKQRLCQRPSSSKMINTSVDNGQMNVERIDCFASEVNFQIIDESMPLLNHHLESTSRSSVELSTNTAPEFETIYSWASAFTYCNLTEFREQMPVSSFELIREQTRDFIEKRSQECHLGENNSTPTRQVYLARLVVYQAEELITTKGWRAEPIRFITANHLHWEDRPWWQRYCCYCCLCSGDTR